MCGICGILTNGPDASRSMLERMNGAISRRGPDDKGIHLAGRVGLAMRRLAIIDLDGGQQPIYNEDGTIAIVFNGEIYNYRQLRQHLLNRGHTFRTNSDTEVIVHLYEEYGRQAASHLSGMFAYAIYDFRVGELHLARDRLGIKPLYYAQTKHGLLFGSEIKCLMASGLVRGDMDLQALDEYLTYCNVPAPRTIYSAVRHLDAGTTMTANLAGEVRHDRYWSIPAAVNDVKPEAEWVAECERHLMAAVQSHLVSDVPVGAFLSGGVDSGLLVALMAAARDRPVETFTVGFRHAGAAFLDERKYARALVQRYRLNHHEIDVDPNFEEILPELVEAFDQPFADDSIVPSYYVSKAAAAHVKVAVTGLGGDELFAGYKRHLGVRLGAKYQRIPLVVRQKLLAPLLRRLPESTRGSDIPDHLKRFASAPSRPEEQYQSFLSSIDWNERTALYTPELMAAVSKEQTEAIIGVPHRQQRDATALGRALRTDLATYLPDDILTLTDRLSMWHSLELRVPYLDHEVVEWAAKIPDDLKIRRLTQKYLLKRVAERWLPSEMIYHRKQGFEAPMGSWLRGPLLPLFDGIVDRKTVEATGLFRYESIAKLREEHVSGRRKRSKALFSLLMLFAWMRFKKH